MSTLAFLGAETGNLKEFTQAFGNMSADNSFKNGFGNYSYKMISHLSSIGGQEVRTFGYIGPTPQQFSSFNTSTSYSRFYINFINYPAVNAGLFSWVNSSLNPYGYLVLTTSGNLAMVSASNSILSTGTTVLNTGTWYRVEVRYQTGASTTYEVKINGVTEFNSTQAILAGNIAQFVVGKNNSNTTTPYSFTAYYDDIFISNSGYPGDGQCSAALIPTANGFYSSSYVGSTQLPYYTNCTDLPDDGNSTYVSFNVGTNQPAVASFVMQTASTNNVGSTIHSVKTVAMTFVPSGSASAVATRLLMQTKEVNATYLGANVGVYNANNFILDKSPFTNNLWTLNDLDNTQSGIYLTYIPNTPGIVDDCRLTAVYLMADSTGLSSNIFSQLGSGTVLISGSALTNYVPKDILISGSSGVKRNAKVVASGDVIISGVSGNYVAHAGITSGHIVISGTVPLAFHTGGIGGVIEISGKANVSHIASISASGGVVIKGFNFPYTNHVNIAGGSVKISGVSLCGKEYVEVGNGTIEISGTYTSRSVFNYIETNTFLLISGRAVLKFSVDRRLQPILLAGQPDVPPSRAAWKVAYSDYNKPIVGGFVSAITVKNMGL